MIKIVAVSLSGQPVGEHNHFARWPDSVVAQARALRGQGLTLRAIAAELGPHYSTLSLWLSGRCRKPPAKYVARRVKVKPADAPSANIPMESDNFSDLA